MFLIANIGTTSKALVTRSDALVTNSIVVAWFHHVRSQAGCHALETTGALPTRGSVPKSTRADEAESERVPLLSTKPAIPRKPSTKLRFGTWPKRWEIRHGTRSC